MAIHLHPSKATRATSGRISQFSTLTPAAQSYWRDGILFLVEQPGKLVDAPRFFVGTSRAHCDCVQTWLQSGPDCNPRQSSHKLHLNRVIPNEVLSLIFS